MKTLTVNEVRDMRPGEYISVDGSLYVKLRQSRWAKVGKVNSRKLTGSDIHQFGRDQLITEADPLQVLAEVGPCRSP